MRAIVAVMLVAVLGGCARKAQVNTAPAPAKSKVSFHMTNNLSQPVNVYVTTGGTDILVGQVSPNSTKTLTVTGVASGATVSLKATAADGTRTYSRDDVVLSGTLNWSVP